MERTWSVFGELSSPANLESMWSALQVLSGNFWRVESIPKFFGEFTSLACTKVFVYFGVKSIHSKVMVKNIANKQL